MPTVALLVGREPSHRYSLHRGYADAVWRTGAVPVVLTPPPTLDGVRAYVAAAIGCDAVCVTGGGDVDPVRYGAPPPEKLMDVDPARDEAEIETVRAAVAGRVPVLGICRGIQVIAVALGGTLVPDLPAAGFAGHWEEERQHEPVHAITATPGSRVAAVLGDVTEVNSIHHQAVASAGPSLTITATSDDGVIEAVEAPGVLGVQWHPERLHDTDARHLAPFQWLTGVAVGA